MVTKGKRQGGNPFLVKGNQSIKLDRYKFEERDYSESWIQEFIYKFPEVLPVNEIDGNFAPLIPIGREVSVASGYIDNLFISPSGYLTIVETKLWRNPQARREVIAQILDYAKDVSQWSFTDLDSRVREFTKKTQGREQDLITVLKAYESFEQNDEQYLIDDITRNLKRGRFLLTIVGDGIRDGVEEMVEYLNSSPQLHFTLSLIELQAYRLEESDSFLVIPQLVTRTREITRAVVRVERDSNQNIQVNIETDLGADDSKLNSSSSGRFTIAEEDFFEQLERNSNPEAVSFAKQLIRDCQKSGYLIDWGQGSFGVKFPEKERGVNVTLFAVGKKDLIHLGWSNGQLEQLGLNGKIADDYKNDISKLFQDNNRPMKKQGFMQSNITLVDVKNSYEQFMMRVYQFVAAIQTEKKDS